MLIRIIRNEHSESAIHGHLAVDGQLLCLTKEPPLRLDGLFVPGESALPPGTYNLSVSLSPKYGRLLPLIASAYKGSERRRVCDRIGMRIHPGTGLDASSEILLGSRRHGRTLVDSIQAFERLFALLDGYSAAIECEVQ